MPIQPMIQGIETIDNNGNPVILKYDYNALANLPKPVKKEIIYPSLLLNREKDGIIIDIINAPQNTPLAIYLFRAQRDGSTNKLIWTHPAHAKRTAFIPEKTAFENKYGQLCSNGYGAGELCDSEGNVIQEYIPFLGQKNAGYIYDDDNELKNQFINTEFPLTSNQKRATLPLNILYNALKPNCYSIQFQVTILGGGRPFYKFNVNYDDQVAFDTYLENIGVKECSTSSFFTTSLDEENQQFLIDQQKSFPSTAVSAFKSWFESYFNSCLSWKLTNSSSSTGTGAREKIKLNFEYENFNSLNFPSFKEHFYKITVHLTDWTNFSFMGTRAELHKLLNAQFKFGLVNTTTGELLTLTPQTIIVGTQFRKKILYNRMFSFSSQNIINALNNEKSLYIPLLHIKIKG